MGILDGMPLDLHCPNCGQDIPAEIGRSDSEDHVCPGCGTVIHVKKDMESIRAAEQPLEDFLREMGDIGAGEP